MVRLALNFHAMLGSNSWSHLLAFTALVLVVPYFTRAGIPMRIWSPHVGRIPDRIIIDVPGNVWYEPDKYRTTITVEDILKHKASRP